MKTENDLLNELQTPKLYIQAVAAVGALKSKAFEDGFYFKNPLYETVDGTRMRLCINGEKLVLIPAADVKDALERLVNPEVITDVEQVKDLIRNLRHQGMPVYWYVLFKYAQECTIVRTKSNVMLFAILGEVGITHQEVIDDICIDYPVPEQVDEDKDEDDDDY